MYVSFDQLPDSARLWVYPADRPLSADEAAAAGQHLQAFCDTWAAHGHPLRSSFRIVEDQLILLAVDEALNAASGCSIDASTHALRAVEQALGVQLLDRGRVVLRTEGGFALVALPKLKAAVADGTLTPETPVVNATAETLGAWRTQPEQLAAESWLRRYFKHKLV
ncbi:MAG: hypothetical protein WBA12_05295 [Catalinimonas sp.]